MSKMNKKARKGKRPNLGMQSVIYGLDENRGVTNADPKAKFIAQNNK